MYLYVDKRVRTSECLLPAIIAILDGSRNDVFQACSPPIANQYENSEFVMEMSRSIRKLRDSYENHLSLCRGRCRVHTEQ